MVCMANLKLWKVTPPTFESYSWEKITCKSCVFEDGSDQIGFKRALQTAGTRVVDFWKNRGGEIESR